VITTCQTQVALDESYKSKAAAQKKLVEELKGQWKLLWSERFDDKQRAEGVSAGDYVVLQVERGTIIHATRDFKALSFREILEKQLAENPECYLQPNNQAGGWGKFVKAQITNQQPQKSRRVALFTHEKALGRHERQQPKKGGRGWLHSV